MNENTGAAPQVSVILVNWNGLPDTRECLHSLARVDYPNVQLIVVDNGSRGGDAAALRSEFPQVRVLETGKNLGFTGGNNVGIREALKSGADYLLCLNNDTVVDPGFLGPLVQALEDWPDAGIATAAIYYHDQPDRLNALGCWLDFSQAAPVVHRDGTAGHEVSLTEPTEVAAVDGCVLLMRRAVAVATRGFDDRFFAYVEDADLCLRARRAGWRCLAVPAARVWHKVGSTTGGENSPTATHYYRRNCCRLVARHGSGPERKAFRVQFRNNWRHELEEYMRDGEADRASWEDPVRLSRLLNCAVDVATGLLGCAGPRSRYRHLEKLIRLGARARIAWAVAAEKRLLRKYRLVYWKMNSVTPRLTRLLPPPLTWTERHRLR